MGQTWPHSPAANTPTSLSVGRQPGRNLQIHALLRFPAQGHAGKPPQPELLSSRLPHTERAEIDSQMQEDAQEEGKQVSTAQTHTHARSRLCGALSEGITRVKWAPE